MRTKHIFRWSLAVIGALALFTQQATAAIVYADASAGNTTVDGAAMVIAPTAGFNVGTATATDGLWTLRSFGNSATLFTVIEDTVSETLNTTVSGLASGTYDAYAYFWVNADEWDISANLNGGTEFNVVWGDAGTIDATTQSFTTSVLTTEGDRTLYAVDLGTFSGTGFTVNVSQGTAGAGGASASRTWYDGVGYSEVPEPSSLALAPFGLAFFARRRRS